MARFYRLWLCLISFLLVSDLAFSVDPPTVSPNLAPESGDDSSFSSPPSISFAPASAPGIQVHQSGISSPPAPSPFASGHSPAHSPVPSPSDVSDVNSPAPSPYDDASDVNSPAPSPSDPSDINHVSDENGMEEESGGMSGVKKVGITIGVVVGAGLVGLGGFVYKKRQENIRRSRYAYAAGGSLL